MQSFEKKSETTSLKKTLAQSGVHASLINGLYFPIRKILNSLSRRSVLSLKNEISKK